LKLKKWRRVTHEETGVSCEVGRLTYSQKPLLVAMMADVFGVVGGLRDEDGTPKAGITMSETTATLRGAFAKLDIPMIENLFKHRVRNIEGLETEEGPIKTGSELLEVVNDELLMWVLGEITSNSELSEEQGKASGSLSTSPSETTPASDSPAESIVSEDGHSRSTVEGTSTGRASSSRVA